MSEQLTHGIMREIASNYLSVLEIGCGSCYNIQYINAPIRVGIDAFEKVLELNPQESIVKLKYDLNNGLRNLLLKKSFDCVVGFDIIEHLELEKAIKLIKECEDVATKCIMFSIPMGVHIQTHDDKGLGNDFYQTHRSTWQPKMMVDLGYEVSIFEDYHHKPNCDSGMMNCIKYL